MPTAITLTTVVDVTASFALIADIKVPFPHDHERIRGSK